MENKLKRLPLITAMFVALSPLTNAQANFDYTTGYIITLGGYFVQPQLSSTQQWVGNFPVNGTLNSQINDGYRFGFLTNILYQFTNTPYNVLAGYNHLDANDNTQTSTNTLDLLSTNSTLDEIDINLGRNFDLAQNLYLRVAAGARYTHIRFKSNFQSTINATDVTTTSGSANASYSGVGPIVFVDGKYLIADSFGVVAHGYAGGIFGNINLSQGDSVQVNDPALNYVAKNQSQLIPNLGGGAGVDYTYTNYKYKFNAELGYMVDYYGSAIMLNNTQNFTGIFFKGPYLDLRLFF